MSHVLRNVLHTRLGQRAAGNVDLLRVGAEARTHPMIVTAVLDGYPVHS